MGVKEREELKAESEELKETVIDLTNESASDKEVKVFSGTEHKAKVDAVSDIAQQETCPDSIAVKESLSSSEKQEKGEEKQEKEEEQKEEEKQEKEEEKQEKEEEKQEKEEDLNQTSLEFEQLASCSRKQEAQESDLDSKSLPENKEA